MKKIILTIALVLAAQSAQANWSEQDKKAYRDACIANTKDQAYCDCSEQKVLAAVTPEQIIKNDQAAIAKVNALNAECKKK